MREAFRVAISRRESRRDEYELDPPRVLPLPLPPPIPLPLALLSLAPRLLPPRARWEVDPDASERGEHELAVDVEAVGLKLSFGWPGSLSVGSFGIVLGQVGADQELSRGWRGGLWSVGERREGLRQWEVWGAGGVAQRRRSDLLSRALRLLVVV
jgi:hypothetical protein